MSDGNGLPSNLYYVEKKIKVLGFFDISDSLGFLRIFLKFSNFWNFWNFLEFLEFFGIFGIFGIFWNFWNFWNFRNFSETPSMVGSRFATCVGELQNVFFFIRHL